MKSFASRSLPSMSKVKIKAKLTIFIMCLSHICILLVSFYDYSSDAAPGIREKMLQDSIVIALPVWCPVEALKLFKYLS